MIKTTLLLRFLSYTPSIKFLGPRSKLINEAHSNATQSKHSSSAGIHNYSGTSSIFRQGLAFPQLSEEEIELINLGGARDPPKPKNPAEKGKKK